MESTRILVVDDSSVVRRALADLLQEAGYEAESAGSGEEAFEKCVSEPFDLVVSDVTMGALSGVQLCRLLRSDPSTSGLPIILLTAADDPRSRFWGRNAGADAYIAKENMSTHLLGEVSRILRDRPRRQMQPVRLTGASDPIQRLSQVLENHLFQAVVASEVRRLMRHLDDRKVFAQSILSLAAEVIDYAYLVLSLEGPEGPTYAVHARAAWYDPPNTHTRLSLGLPENPDASIDVICEIANSDEDLHIEVGDKSTFPVEAGGEKLGELSVCGGRKRLGGRDRSTVELLASEIGVVVKSLFLMEETQRLAQTDGLTGLYNRRYSSERLHQEVERSNRHNVPLSVAICDIDHFKQVNDRYGHNAGDDVIRSIAAILKDSIRTVDVVGRWGGEEFLILMLNTAASGAQVVAERLRRRIAHADPIAGGPPKVTVSIGVVPFRQGMSAEAFVESADQALYRAKQNGRNRVEGILQSIPPHSG